jgi:hypothetical protein
MGWDECSETDKETAAYLKQTAWRVPTIRQCTPRRMHTLACISVTIAATAGQ